MIETKVNVKIEAFCLECKINLESELPKDKDNDYSRAFSAIAIYVKTCNCKTEKLEKLIKELLNLRKDDNADLKSIKDLMYQ